MGAAEQSAIEIRAQPGPQEMFLASQADVAIFGGSAFSAKTYALLLEDLRHIHDADFRSVTFRRQTTQVRNPGGLWDESKRVYGPFGSHALSNSLEHVFPSGAVSKFAHLENRDDVYGWDGAQIPLLKFDQLEHFERSQFFYMLSRNRDPSGKIKPYVRATCNPDPESWLADFLEWWIDQSEKLPNGDRNERYGYPIWERSGVLRWMHREGDDIYWADTRGEIMRKFSDPDLPADHPEQPRPISVTFIPGRIYDNVIGLKRDPGYLAKLKALPYVERVRLLGHPQWGGNWKIKAAAGLMFQRHWCPTLDVEPDDVIWVRGWDLAATKPNEQNPNPDWTCSVRLGKYRASNRYVIAPDVVRMRDTPAKVETAFVNTCTADGRHVKQRIPQDPGQAGKAQVANLIKLVPGARVHAAPVTGDKVTRFGPFSAQAEAGNVDLVRGIPEAFLAGLENFPPATDAGHDDEADATSTAFEEFVVVKGGTHIIEFYRKQLEEARKAKENGDDSGEEVAAAAAQSVVITASSEAKAEQAPVVVEEERPAHRFPDRPLPTSPADVARRTNGGMSVKHTTRTGWE